MRQIFLHNITNAMQKADIRRVMNIETEIEFSAWCKSPFSMARLPGQAISENTVMVNRSKLRSIIGDLRSKWLSTVTTPAISVLVFVLTPIQSLSVSAQIHRADDRQFLA